MFVQGNQRSECARSERGEQQGRTRSITGRRSVNLQMDFATNFPFGYSDGQGLRLREHIGHQRVVVGLGRAQGGAVSDEVARHHVRALVEQLKERVLGVRSQPAPHHGGRRRHRCTVAIHRLAVALHDELLQIARQ